MEIEDYEVGEKITVISKVVSVTHRQSILLLPRVHTALCGNYKFYFMVHQNTASPIRYTWCYNLQSAEDPCEVERPDSVILG